MNADELLQHYGRVADAPDAVVRLRRFVIDLAVRGKLVPQDPKDEFSRELARHTLDSTGGLEVPRGWCRASVGELLNFQYGKGLKANARAADGPVPVFGSNGIVGYTDVPLTSNPSIIVGRKGSAGALNVCNGPSWTTDVAYFVEAPPYFDLRFLYLSLEALDLGTLGKGVKPGLGRSDTYDKLLRVPPLAEQHRIVAKVDELMALSGQLEAARTQREAARDRLARSCLARLDTPDLETFREDARFALDALPALSARPDQIKQLRQTILNLAVRGKLVAQNPSDEPASRLVAHISNEKLRLAAEGQLKKDKEGRDDLPMRPSQSLPHNWVWVRLQDVFEISRGGSPRPAGDPRFFGGPIPWITVREITKDDGKYLERTDTGLTEDGASRSRFIDPGDLLLTNSGATLGVPKISRIRACMNDGVAVLRQFHDIDLNDFAYLYLTSQTDVFRAVNQGMGQPNLNTTIIAGWPFPLAPLAEQHRIVAKVDELMRLCDRLEASLQQADEHRRRLLEALLHQALEPAATLEEQAA